ncbi:MAG: DoxX family protein [Bacteroidota bacterium]
MTQKARNIIGWTLTGILAFVFISSAFMKLTGSEEVVKGAASIGLTPGAMQLIGIIEIGSILLFIFPRTGLLGTLLLAAYLGGAIVTLLEHGQPFLMPVIIQAILWITAVIRFPELSKRLFVRL